MPQFKVNLRAAAIYTALAVFIVSAGAWATRDQLPGSQGGHTIFTTVKNATITIATDDNTSDTVDLEDYSLVGMVIPAALTSTAITFNCSTVSGGTFSSMYDANNAQISVTVAVSRHYDLTVGAKALNACRFVQLEMGSSEAANRTIPLILAR